MFQMTSSNGDVNDDCKSYIEMTVRDTDDLSLAQMLAYFMQMMHKCGYHDKSWDSVIDEILEWRTEDPDNWVTNFSLDVF